MASITFSDENNEETRDRLSKLICLIKDVNHIIDNIKLAKKVPDKIMKNRIKVMMTKCINLVMEILELGEEAYMELSDKIDSLYCRNYKCEKLEEHERLVWVSLIYEEPIGTDFFKIKYGNKYDQEMSVDLLNEMNASLN